MVAFIFNVSGFYLRTRRTERTRKVSGEILKVGTCVRPQAIEGVKLIVLPVTVLSAVLLLRTGKAAKLRGDAAIATSKTVHVATKGGKVTNAKKVKISKKKITLGKGSSKQLRASAVKAAKRLKIRTHRKLQWESSDTSVARVTASGKVRAKKAGTCYVYAYAQDGVFARCKVTVN